jgi:SAM-dependent methyltransferase
MPTNGKLGNLVDGDLAANAFRRYDESSDADFYQSPRLVTHIDDEAIAAVTQIYREYLPAGGAIVDLMSSWVSHLPPDVEYRRVVGLGMNAEELAANPRLTYWLVHDLNAEPAIPLHDGEFDAATICVSIQYLVHPVTVLRDIGRVVRPGGPLIITFSNRCFPTKAVYLWQSLNDAGHVQLVEQYFEVARNWRAVEVLDRSPNPGRTDPLYAVIGRSAGPASA